MVIKIVQVNIPSSRLVTQGEAILGNEFPVKSDDGFHTQLDQRAVTRQEYLETDVVLVDIGDQPNPLNSRLRNRLEPHALPDPGCPRIEDARRLVLPVLLASRKRNIAAVVRRLHDKDVLPFGEHIGDVGRKRRMSAFMQRHQLAVHPNFGLVINGSKMQQQAPGLVSLRDGKRSPVPNLVMYGWIADAAKLALITERNVDFSAIIMPLVPGFPLTDSLIVKIKLPFSV
ncbi:hypothetical protein D3C74_258100 [compost metagenome]